MRYQGMGARNFLLLVVTLTGLFLFVEGSSKMSISLQPIEALQHQQQSVSTVCSGNSCLTTTCTNSQPCQTLRSNSNPVPLDDTMTMQPVEDTPGTIQPPEDDMEVIAGIINDD
ncbi:MAG TPA: hypothetical protein VKA95_15035 [Nitrososphaeraceae archaeon]|nr:hypothetical protein [Nitrososphaeraceae archaeon]